MNKSIFLETDRVYTVLRSMDPVARAADEIARGRHLGRESHAMRLTETFVQVLAASPIGGDTVAIYGALTALINAASLWQAAISDSWLDDRAKDHEGAPLHEGGEK